MEMRMSKAVEKIFKSICGMKIENGGGTDHKKIDSLKEYTQLQKLLSGNMGVELTNVDVLMLSDAAKEYEDRFGVPCDLKDEENSTTKENKQPESMPKPNNKTPKEKLKPGKEDPKTAQKPNNETTKEILKPGKEDPKTAQKPNNETPKEKLKPGKEDPKTAQKPNNETPKEQIQPDNKNDVQFQKGYNNGIAVNGNNNVVIVESSAKATNATESEPIKSSDAQQTKSKEEVRENALNTAREQFGFAYKQGEQVAKDLIGPTNTEEKSRVISTIRNQTPESIIGFIIGFNENDTVMGIPYGIGSLLDQIDNEGGLFDENWTKEEKARTFAKVISSVLSFCEKVGFENDPNYKNLKELSQDVAPYKEINTEYADSLINKLVERAKSEM